MNKYSIVTKIIICLVLVSIVFVNFFTLAKYYSEVTGTATTSVAKWNNNIEIVGANSFELVNAEVNSVTLTFNVISNSDVNSKFDIALDTAPKCITYTLNNATKTGSVLVESSTVTVSMGLDEEEFTIPNTSASTTIGNITMTSSTTADGIDLTFTKANETMSIIVKLTNNVDTYDMIFHNFGTINKGANQTVQHTLVISTDAISLPGSSNMDLYAILEQTD